MKSATASAALVTSTAAAAEVTAVWLWEERRCVWHRGYSVLEAGLMG